MSVTRKEFLSLVAAGAAGAALAPRSLLAAAAEDAAATAEKLRAAVGQPFTLTRPDGRTVDLVLSKFVERPADPDPAEKTVQFSLVFEAPGGERIARGTYPLQGKAVGMTVFLVPARTVGPRTSYRADFNLLSP